MKVLKIALLAVAVITTGCKQNPWEGRDRVVQAKPPELPPRLPPLTLNAPQSVELLEGNTLELPLSPSVPAPGKPMITVKGLPDGAIFEPETSTIHWVADFESANDPRNPAITTRTYPLEFIIASSENPVTVNTFHTLLVVRDVPRTTSLNLPTSAIELTEGQELTQAIAIESEDFPQGPFELHVQNLPVGAAIHRDLANPGRFLVKYTPPFSMVNVSEAFSSYRTYLDRDLEVEIFGPRGVTAKGKVTWRIYDSRQKPLIRVPSTITQGTTVGFTITTEDPNGEKPPLLSLEPRPAFGVAELRTEAVNNGDRARGINPSVVSFFRWTMIPPEKIGTEYELTFKACVHQNRYSITFCDRKSVKVKFESEQHRAPVVDRSAAPTGNITYLRERETAQMRIGVKDGEFLSVAPKVEITPASAADEVSWSGGLLKIEGKKPGLKQFQLTATSVYGVQKVESFLYEVLPSGWGSVLSFAESPTDPEAKAIIGLFDSVQLANPVLQLLDPRLMVLRKTVTIGTTAFNEAAIVGEMEKQAVLARDVLITTPLLGRLTGALKAELTALGIKAGARVADLVDYEFSQHSNSGLISPALPLKLQGKLTPESAQPTVVESAGPGDCQALWVLKKTGEADLPLGYTCKRTSGGRIVIAGFELGDLQPMPTVPGDRVLVKKWLTELVAQ